MILAAVSDISIRLHTQTQVIMLSERRSRVKGTVGFAGWGDQAVAIVIK